MNKILYGKTMENLRNRIDKDMLNFSNFQNKSNYNSDLKKLVIVKMKNETYGVANEQFVRFKPKLYMFLVDDNSEHKNAMVVNRNIVQKVNCN